MFCIGMCCVSANMTVCDVWMRRASVLESIIVLDLLDVFDALQIGEDDFFEFSSTTTGCSLSVSVTGISGDPDLYVSTSAQYMQPTREQFLRSGQTSIFRSNGWGSDHLEFLTDSDTVPKYYIGIHAYTSTTFTVLVSMETCSSQPSELPLLVTLVDGIGQSTSLGAREFQYVCFFHFGIDGLVVRL